MQGESIMDNEEAMHELGPHSAAIVDALIRCAPGRLEIGLEAEGAIERFACGWVTTKEHDNVVAALTRSQALRSRLFEVREQLKAANLGLDAQAAVFAEDPALGRTMREALSASLSAYADWGSACAKALDVATERKDLARTFRSAIGRLVEGARSMVTGPRFAASRTAAEPHLVVVAPGNRTAELVVRHDSDDRIVAEARFNKPFGEPTEVSLYLVEPGGGWAWLGSSIARGQVWNLTTEGCEEISEIPPGRLDSRWFALSEGRRSPRKSLATNGPPVGHDEGSALRLTLVDAPTITNGVLTLSVEVPKDMPRHDTDARLQLAVDVGETIYVLNEWKVKDLPVSGPVALRAQVPGIPDCALELSSVLRLSIR